MTDHPTRALIDLRSSVIVGLFILTAGLLWMIYDRPSLLDSAPFMTLATLIVGGSGLGAIVAWLFGGTKTGSEVMAANAQALSGQTVPPSDSPAPAGTPVEPPTAA